MRLKDKTVSGLSWSIVDNFSKQGITFIIGIILARLLSPKDFGLVGLTSIFITLSYTFIDSGFSQALIRKTNCDQKDYSTVFYFNIFIALIFFLVIYALSSRIALFFDEPQLTSLIKVLSISIVISSFSIIQIVILTKNLNFKLQTKISVISTLCSGILGVTLAYSGAGVWSLVFKGVIGSLITTLLFWFWSTWKPIWVFSRKTFSELFGFGSKLLLSGLLDKAYRNTYLIVIGKFFSATELGFFTRADQFKKLPSQNITTVIQRVSFPVLSSIQNDLIRLKAAYRRLIKTTMFVTFLAMICLAAIAKPLVFTLIGEQWEQTISYLQLLCFAGMFYPLHAMNLNLLKVKGRSDIFLKLEIYKKIIAVPVILSGIFWGIEIMISGMIISSVISFFINSFYSGRLINYSSKNQIKDILPSFGLSVTVGLSTWFLGFLLHLPDIWVLTIQSCFALTLIIFICELFNFESYIFIKKTIRDRLKAKQ